MKLQITYRKSVHIVPTLVTSILIFSVSGVEQILFIMTLDELAFLPVTLYRFSRTEVSVAIGFVTVSTGSSLIP